MSPFSTTPELIIAALISLLGVVIGVVVKMAGTNADLRVDLAQARADTKVLTDKVTDDIVPKTVEAMTISAEATKAQVDATNKMVTQAAVNEARNSRGGSP